MKNLVEKIRKGIHYKFFRWSIDNDDIIYEECTVELRAMIGDQIRLVFYSMDKNITDDYEQDYSMSIPKFPCLRIRDVCLIIFFFFHDFDLFRMMKQ
jgi:hypothetical protein